MRRILRRLLGESASRALAAGAASLRLYPTTVLGDGRAGPPEFVALELTWRCNARCRMCPFYGEHRTGSERVGETADHPTDVPGNEELSTGAVKDFLSQCSALGVRSVSFTGGEPFLRPDLPELIAHASERGLSTIVVTNGSLLDESGIEAILDAGLDHLNLSLDGPPEIHNGIRRMAGLFGRVDAAVGALRAVQVRRNTRRPLLSLHCTVSALNQETLGEVAEIARRWEAPVSFSPVSFTTEEERDPGAMSFRLPRSTLRVDPAVIAAGLKSARLRGGNVRVLVPDVMRRAEDIEAWFLRPDRRFHRNCFHPWRTLRLDPRGRVQPCFLPVTVGDITTDSLEAIWNGPAFRDVRRTQAREGLSPGCARCCMLYQKDPIRRLLPRAPRIFARSRGIA